MSKVRNKPAKIGSAATPGTGGVHFPAIRASPGALLLLAGVDLGDVLHSSSMLRPPSFRCALEWCRRWRRNLRCSGLWSWWPDALSRAMADSAWLFGLREGSVTIARARFRNRKSYPPRVWPGHRPGGIAARATRLHLAPVGGVGGTGELRFGRFGIQLGHGIRAESGLHAWFRTRLAELSGDAATFVQAADDARARMPSRGPKAEFLCPEAREVDSSFVDGLVELSSNTAQGAAHQRADGRRPGGAASCRT